MILNVATAFKRVYSVLYTNDLILLVSYGNHVHVHTTYHVLALYELMYVYCKHYFQFNFLPCRFHFYSIQNKNRTRSPGEGTGVPLIHSSQWDDDLIELSHYPQLKSGMFLLSLIPSQTDSLSLSLFSSWPSIRDCECVCAEIHLTKTIRNAKKKKLYLHWTHTQTHSMRRTYFEAHWTTGTYLRVFIVQ